MATTNSITTTYVGEYAKKYVSAALLTAPTITNGLVEVMPNVKYRTMMQRLETGTLLQNANCDFTPGSSVTMTERWLEVKDLEVNLQLCKKTYHDTWQGIEQGYSSWDVLPKSFADYLLTHIAAKVSAENEVNIWRGATGSAGQFNGFATIAGTDADLPSAQEVAGTTVTASNVLAELRKIIAATPLAVKAKPDFTIYVAHNIKEAYVQALGGFGASGLGANGIGGNGALWYNSQPLYIDGYKIEAVMGLAANTAIATTKSNLFFGCSVLSDTQEVKVIDTSETLGDNNVRIIMKMAAGTQIAVIEDVVTYGITNAAN